MFLRKYSVLLNNRILKHEDYMDHIYRKCKEIGIKLKLCNELIDEIECLMEELPFTVSIQIDEIEHDDCRIFWCPSDKFIVFEDSRVSVPLSCTKAYCKLVCYSYLIKLKKTAEEKILELL